MESKKNNIISIILLIIIIGVLAIVLLVNFNVIDNPIYLIKGNEIKEIYLTTNSLEMRKGEMTHLETINENTDSLVFTSSDSNIVTVNEITGYIVAVNSGTATITVRLKNHDYISDTCEVTVIKPVNTVNAESIAFTTSSISLNVGSSRTLYYKITPSNAGIKKIIWSTSDDKVATIDKYGTVNAVGVGKATIRVKTDNGKTATCIVNVIKNSSTTNIAVTSISLNKTNTTIVVGNNETLLAKVNPQTATNKSVTWTSSNSKIATVDNNGKVTGISTGTVTITAKTSNGKTAQAQITVKDNKKSGSIKFAFSKISTYNGFDVKNNLIKVGDGVVSYTSSNTEY